MPPPRKELREVDVLVIGGGVVGAAAALEAQRGGARVALAERATLETATGSSKGTARIYAPAAYPDESYLRMALRALELWERIEAETGTELLDTTGALSIGEFAARELPALRQAGLQAEQITAAEAERRFGICLGDERPIVHQPGAGIIRADRARSALLELARAAGVELHQLEQVHSLVDEGESVEVAAEVRMWRCASVIVAAGPWSTGLLAGAGIELPVSPSCQSVAYFELDDPTHTPVAVMEYDGDEPYALWDPERGLKAALHQRGPAPDPAGERPAVDPGAIERLTEWVGERFPQMGARLGGTEPCLYTNTSDERFVIERHGRIALASACSGHGFQFAPETGRRVAKLALEPLGAAVG